MPFIAIDQMRKEYETVIVGSGFGALFFAYELLKKPRPGKVLMLEWGANKSHAWQVANKRNSVFEEGETHRELNEKIWHYTIGFGGGTNCWWAYAPRNHPHDFETKSRYGVGQDWPISYDDLALYYDEAEQVMNLAGPEDLGLIYPGAGGYPQPPHRMAAPDRLMKQAMPELHFAQPNGRLSRSIGSRGSCCVTTTCRWCPVDAKFTGLNSFGDLFQHPDLDILCEARVDTLERAGGDRIESVAFEHKGRVERVKGDLVALAANGIHSPFIMMKSGFDEPALGRYLHEKRSIDFEILLDGMDGLDGSSILSSLNVMMLTGEHRREHAGGLYNFDSHTFFGVRLEYGRWSQSIPLNVLVEDIPQEESRVTIGEDGLPETFAVRSDYCNRGAQAMIDKLPELLAPLPVEDIVMKIDDPNRSVHVQGTTRMGVDPTTSVVDADQRHHSVRNLMLLGTSVFPTSGTASPSLTIAAMSLRAARRLENIGA